MARPRKDISIEEQIIKQEEAVMMNRAAVMIKIINLSEKISGS